MKKQSSLILMIIAIAAATILAACGSGGGGTPQQTAVKLAQTGQTTIYAAGDDGDKKAGVAWPSPRFTDPDGTTPVTGSVVVDQLTGLMWLRDANCMQTRDAANPGAEFDNDGTVGDGLVTWQHALDFVAGVNAGTYSICGGGYADWRLPNRNELRSLIDYSRNNPALQAGHPFTKVQIGNYWSSTSYASNTANAWCINIGLGDVVNIVKEPNFHHVWAVRSGQ